MSKRTRKPSGKKQKYKAPVLYINHNARRKKTTTAVFFSLILVVGSPRVPAPLSLAISSFYLLGSGWNPLGLSLCSFPGVEGEVSKLLVCLSPLFPATRGPSGEKGRPETCADCRGTALLSGFLFSLSFQPPFRAFFIFEFLFLTDFFFFPSRRGYVVALISVVSFSFFVFTFPFHHF